MLEEKSLLNFKFVTSFSARRFNDATLSFSKQKDKHFYLLLDMLVKYLPPQDAFSAFRIQDYFEYNWGDAKDIEPYMFAQRAFFKGEHVVGTVTLETGTCPPDVMWPRDIGSKLKTITEGVQVSEREIESMFGTGDVAVITFGNHIGNNLGGLYSRTKRRYKQCVSAKFPTTDKSSSEYIITLGASSTEWGTPS